MKHIKITYALSCCLFLLTSTLALAQTGFLAQPAANLDQARNGDPAAPVDPINWVNGNLGAQQSHYVEGHSVPYRAVMTDMPDNTVVTIIIEYDIKHSDKHALDYLTHYNRLLPHPFPHGTTPETINPLDGTGLPSGTTFTTFTIPAPSTGPPTSPNPSPVPGQPLASYNVLPAGEKLMTLYNGTITNIVYVNPQGDLTASQSATQVAVTFTTPTFGAGAHTCVLTWGGHIASLTDWGFVGAEPRSANGISGSPYHMRLINWNLNNLGNQDRSLSAGAVAPPPDCGISGDSLICGNETTQLCGLAGMATYLWSTGATTQCITVSIGGSYTVTVHDANNGSNTCTEVVTQIPSPTCNISGDLDICDGESTQLDAGAGFEAYLWSTGASTQTISVTGGGTYTVTVTNASGCTSSCSATVIVNPLPPCNITGDLIICSGESTQLCTSGGTAYLWSNGATTACITVSNAGTYTATVTYTGGCTSSCNTTVTVNQLPSCSISGNNFCNGSSTQLCAATYSSYLWSTGATTQCITVTSGGTYTVTVTDGNGCTSSCSKTVIAYTLPTCSITGGNFCNGSSTQLCAATNSSYLWSTGATTQCITVTNGGTYTVTVTDGNGCTASCSKTVTEYTLPVCLLPATTVICSAGALPLCASAGFTSYLWSSGSTDQCINLTIGGAYTVTVTNANGCTSTCSTNVIIGQPNCSITGGNFCDGSSTQLCSATNSSYLWSTGATTQCITVTSGGTYTVTVTDGNGCTASCSKTVIAYTLPTCSITGGNFCNGSSTQLCAATNSSYLWSTSATTQCITVTTGGTYTVTVTDGNGCTSSCSKTVVAYTLPTCSITGGNFCNGSSTQLCAATNSSYLWSTGATTQCITVTTGGTYTITVTDGNGCTSSCSKTVVAYTLPTCSITGGNFCNGSSTQLCAATNSSYLWSTGATTQCITVTTGGTYTVTVTDGNGCTSSCSKTVVAYTLPTCSITGGNFCNGSSTQLCAATNSSYLWSTGATTQCITVTTGGTYTVTVTDGNGCTSSCSKTVVAYTLPTCSITGGNFCSGSSTQLCAATNSSYLWSTGATTQCITVTTGGTYTVTVTDGNGCSSSCSKTVVAYPLPTCAITGSLFYCQGSNTQICTPAGLTGYLWSTGATTQCITVTAGDYTVTVTNANGCTSSCTAKVTQRQNPVCSITGTGTVCVGGSAQWCAAAAPVGYTYSYSWSTGATTQCITVSSVGTYTITITDQYGCSSSCSKSLTNYTPPTCAITGTFFYCQGSNTQICAPAGLAGYLWNTGATTQCVTVTAGDYTVTITNGNGCTSSCTAKVTQRQLPNCSITGSSSVCQGGSAQWCSAAAPVGYTYTYVWSSGATTQCITVSTAGTYTVTVTDQYGCSKSCSKTFTVKALPACSITGPGSVCQGNSTQWCAPAGLASYLWNTGATTQCITVSTAGTYTVTVTNANGCTRSCSKSLTVKSLPSCTISGNLFYCQGSNTQICAPASLAAYLWNTGATTRCITVTAGDYTVTVTNANGCTSSCTAKVTARQNPVCSITGTGIVCIGGSAQWCAAAAVGYTYSYSWSTGATTQCITVSTVGTYIVTITDQYGCSSSCSKSLSNYTPPTCAITGSLFYCQGSNTQICAPAGLAGYLWSTGATTQCITVTAGDYTVTVTDANGCTSSCTAKVTARQNPVCSITGTGIVCIGGSAQWCAAIAPVGYTYSYSWSTGATTQCITVSTVGTYTVTITDQYGCSSSCSKSLSNYTPPTCAITGSLFYCQGSNTQICAPAGLAAYLWSTGATTQCITVTAGDYTVTVTNANGCTSSCTAKVTARQNPVCSITGNAKVCPGGSTQWCAAAAPVGYTYSYSWSTGATTQCITVSSVGTYTVTITDQYGCSSSCSKSLTNYALPNCPISGSGSVCPGYSTQWCAPAGLASYLWSTGATTQCITVSTVGTYTVTVTNANGCTKSCSKSLSNYTPPTCAITGSLFYCQGSNTQICAPAGLAGYLWNTGATTQCITVTAGDYTVTVTNSHSCSSSCTAKVTARQNPVCSITGNAKVCPGASTQWCAATAPVGYTYSYAWNSGATTRCVTVSAVGTYTVTITDQYGCSSSCSKSLTNYTPPTCFLPSTTIVCANGLPPQLCGPPAMAGYLWSTGATTQCINVSAAGIYTLTVTDANGCTGSCYTNVITPLPPNCTITGNFFYCQGGNTQICTRAGLNYTYLWNTGATTQCITVTAGDYTVTVTDGNGCTSSCTAKVTPRQLPNCSITGSNSVCQGGSAQWCAAAAPVGYTYTYVWGTGATTQCITVSTAGTYTVTVTDQYGCSKSCSKTFTVNALPACSITGLGSVCQGNSRQWCAPAGLASYLWNTGATTQCITVSTAGTYTVTVTNTYGCTRSCSKSLTVNTLPACSITGTNACFGGSTQLCAAVSASYVWSTGSTSQCITVSTGGTYTVTITNAAGCTSSCTKSVTECCDGFRTQTLGGWGAVPNGSNNGTYLYNHFASVFPAPNYLTIGCTNKFRFTTPQSITAFLPAGSTPAGLPAGVTVNPASAIGNTFASQLIAATLNVKFDLADPNFSSNSIHLQDLVITSGTFAGWTVSQLLTEANKKIGGCASSYSYSQLNNALDNVNQNYHNGTANGGFLDCPGSARLIDGVVTETNEGDIEVSAYPNPFSQTATIEFQNTKESGHVVVELFNLTGSKMAVLFDKEVEQGVMYQTKVNSANLSEGVYFYKIVSGDNIVTGKLILLKQ